MLGLGSNAFGGKIRSIIFYEFYMSFRVNRKSLAEIEIGSTVEFMLDHTLCPSN